MRRYIEMLWAGWRRWRTPAAAIWRQVAGWPDYAAYLEHCRRAGHPPRLTEPEFLDAYFRSRSGARRCC